MKNSAGVEIVEIPICACGKQSTSGQCEHVNPWALRGISTTLPATAPHLIDALTQAQELIKTCPQIELPTEHIIHRGMYARTVRMPAGSMLIGALIKVPTMLVVHGDAKVFVADGWSELSGYNVFPASAGRKQMFAAITDVEITMMFPTQAKTVAEAEQEFTDECDELLSRRQDNEKVTITGE